MSVGEVTGSDMCYIRHSKLSTSPASSSARACQCTMSFASIIKTYARPQEVVACAPVTLSALLLHLLPQIIQGGLLHPSLDRLRWARWLRFAMTPLGVYCGLKLPIDYCFIPTDQRGYPNLALACASLVILSRAIEWGFLKNYHHGKFWKRPEFIHSGSTSIHSSSNITSSSHSQEHQSLNTTPSSFSFHDWLGWTLELVSSVRGQQYGWGVKIPPHTESAIELIKRMYRLNVIHVLATGFAIMCRDEGSATKALRHLGLPTFYGEGIIPEGLLNLAFGFYLITMIELGFGYLTLVIHIINLINTRVIRLPDWLMRSCDLKLFSPLFNRPHQSPSLAHLWGKAWHQMFRQSFLVLGAFPATLIVKKFGFGSKSQRLVGMLACFLVSATLHEYAIHFVARQPHPDAHIFYQEFPGSSSYFILQAIGIVIEPYVIPMIPGEGLLWSYIFTLLTVTPFRKAYFKGHRFLDYNYSSPIDLRWVISSLLLPGSTSLH